MGQFVKVATSIAFMGCALLASAAPKPSSSSAWKPAPFVFSDRLPPNYRGTDAAKFLMLFKAKLKSTTKGEFETSEEFARKMVDAAAILSPISTSDLYAFRMSRLEFAYDADAQVYAISTWAPTCTNTYSADWTTCKVARVRNESGTYAGSNAYGASRTVERYRGLDFALALPKTSPALQAVFFGNLTGFAYQDKLPVSLQKAKSLKGKTLTALFVGRITDAKLIEGRGIVVKPTLSDPTDMFIEEEAVPFEAAAIIYYVFETGEILGTKEL